MRGTVWSFTASFAGHSKHRCHEVSRTPRSHLSHTPLWSWSCSSIPSSVRRCPGHAAPPRYTCLTSFAVFDEFLKMQFQNCPDELRFNATSVPEPAQLLSLLGINVGLNGLQYITRRLSKCRDPLKVAPFLLRVGSVPLVKFEREPAHFVEVVDDHSCWASGSFPPCTRVPVKSHRLGPCSPVARRIVATRALAPEFQPRISLPSLSNEITEERTDRCNESNMWPSLRGPCARSTSQDRCI